MNSVFDNYMKMTEDMYRSSEKYILLQFAEWLTSNGVDIQPDYLSVRDEEYCEEDIINEFMKWEDEHDV